LNTQRSEITKLVIKSGDLKSKDTINPVINDIIKNLNEVAGVEDEYAGQGTNADKAEALALKTSVYMKVVQILLENSPQLKVAGGIDAGGDGDVTRWCHEIKRGRKARAKRWGRNKEWCHEIKRGTKKLEITEDIVPLENLDNYDLREIIKDAINKNLLDSRCKDYINLVEEIANNYDEFDALMLFSIMHQESKCDVNAESGSSYGLMQISSFGECNEIGIDDIEDIKGEGKINKNIECGALILKKKITMFSDSMEYKCDSYEFSENRIEPAVDYTYKKGTIEYGLRGL